MESFFLIVLIVTMFVALGSGYPVAFALPGSAIVTIGLAAAAGFLFEGSPDAYFHSSGPSQWLSAGVTNLRGVYWEVDRDTLIAIPLFIFMGIMLQRSMIAEDLLVAMAQLFGPVPGGLGISVVFVGGLLAATTGIVGATVVAMGLISLPAMMRSKYSVPLACGTIAASGTLGQIIPPSIVLIILADQLASATDQASTGRKELYTQATGDAQMPTMFDVGSTSAGELFLGAIVPGTMLVLIYMAFILILAIIRPKMAPAVPFEGKMDGAFWKQIFIALVPPLALIFLVLGSIITGVATVNQAGAIGAAGAMVMAGYRLGTPHRTTYLPLLVAAIGLGIITFALSVFPMNLKASVTASDWVGIYVGLLGSALLIGALIWSGLRMYRYENTLNMVMLETAKTSSLVFIILLGAALLTAAFRAFGGEELVREFLTGLPGGFWSQFIIVMAVIFFMGFFLDFIEIAVVVVPIVSPILLSDPSANITAVWLGVMIGLNMQTSFLTPPFGFALFYLRGVAPPSITTGQIYQGVVPFIGLQLLALAIAGYLPSLINYVPLRSAYLSETAPPPKNPRLQYCVEEQAYALVESGTATPSAAIAALRGADLSSLPADLQAGLTRSMDQGEAALAMIPGIRTASAAVADAAPDYRPTQVAVRAVEKKIRRIEKHIAELDQESNRLLSDGDAARNAELDAERAVLQAEIDALRAEIPNEWTPVREAFQSLVKAEDTARANHRRAADTAYEEAANVLATLNGTQTLLALEPEIAAQRVALESGDPEATMKVLEDLASRVRAVEGAGDVRTGLVNARRVLDRTPNDRAAAVAAIDASLAALEGQKAWRQQAETARPAVQAYVDAIQTTLGARSLPRLTTEQAVYAASCNANHRDISLSF